MWVNEDKPLANARCAREVQFVAKCRHSHEKVQIVDSKVSWVLYHFDNHITAVLLRKVCSRNQTIKDYFIS